jgi:hypothetical protein
MIWAKVIGVMLATAVAISLFVYLTDRAMLSYPRTTKIWLKTALFAMQAVFMVLLLMAIFSGHPTDCDDKVFCMVLRSVPSLAWH